MPSAEPPDLLDGIVIHAHLQTKDLPRIGLDLAQALREFIRVFRHNDDLAVGDADEFTRMGRCRVGSRFGDDLPGQLAIKVLHRA